MKTMYYECSNESSLRRYELALGACGRLLGEEHVGLKFEKEYGSGQTGSSHEISSKAGEESLQTCWSS